MEKPKPPIGRMIREGDYGRKCPRCGSSLKRRKWYHFHRTVCVHQECSYGKEEE